MTRGISLLFLTSLLAAGCGDDSGGTDAGPPGVDGGDAVMCPRGDMVPDQAGFMGPCCYRESNAGRLDSPTFRLSGLNIDAPASLNFRMNFIVATALTDALDQEDFNWLLEIGNAGADGEVTIRTGFGIRNADATFSFDTVDYPPLEVTGTLSGETISAPAFAGNFAVPVVDEVDPTMVVLVLPLRYLELNGMTMSDDRSCVGHRMPREYDASQADLTAFVPVDEVREAAVSIPPLETTVCDLVGNMAARMDLSCAETPQAMWPTPPDSMCNEDGTCAMGGCTPDTCNAWRIHTGFAAHGVTIR